MTAADGSKLSGSYSASSSVSFPTLGATSGGAFSSHAFTFAADGTFTAAGSSGVSAGFKDGAGRPTGGAVAEDDTKSKSQYEIKDGLISFHTNGATTTRNILIYDKSMILLDGVSYLKSN